MSEYITASDPVPSLANDALITILPVHAGKIYTLSKKFELRKSAPRLVPRRLFLYETGDVRAITGHVVVDRVLSGIPEEVWRLTRERATTRPRFDHYFRGRKVAYAYSLSSALRYSRPMPLPDILEIEPGFRVPQQFLYLQNLPSLHRRLRTLCINECLSLSRSGFSLREISDTQRADFVRSVSVHISSGYSETGRAYAQK